MYKDLDKRREWSREFQKKYRKRPGMKEKEKIKSAAKYLKRREFLDNYRSEHPCFCGESDLACLDFHHVDGTKEGNVSTISGRKKMMEEIAKCIVVCANCHRKLHYGKERESEPLI